MTLIRHGERSEKVSDVQARLRGLGFVIDDEPGLFDDSTRTAVWEFQQQRGILVDGIVGPNTWSELVEASWLLGDRVLYLKHPFMRGDDVLSLQERLNALGYDARKEDGIYGPDTDAAVRAFQREYGIVEDGMYGRETHAALSGLRINRPGTAARLREEVHLSQARPIEDHLVVIDPGHGADDTGCVSSTGLTERDACWDIARRLAEKLAGAGARVRFTRTEIENPTPSERARRANEVNADVFLTLHLNVHDSATASGCSTFHFGGSRSGERLAEAIHSQLVGLGLYDCRVHDRSYALLKETRMPAVVLEPCFMTNPGDAGWIAQATARGAVADALLAGLRIYFSGDPA